MKDNQAQINNPQSISVEMDYENDKNIEQLTEQSTEEVNNQESVKEGSEEHRASEEQDNSPENEQNQKRPRSKRWEKERRDREEKYLLAQALAEEKKRNLELRNYLERSVDNNTMSAAEKAMRDLEQAEIAHAAALEKNDALAASKASTALIQANLAVERIANIKMYSKDQEQDYSQINPAAYAADKTLNDWLIDNPEFDEESKSFNKDLVVKITPLIRQLDAKLTKRGQAHLISSPAYFDIIDSFIAQTKSDKKYDRPATGSVNSRNNQYKNVPNQRIQLTEQQRRAAAGCNMSEEQYISWLQKYEREKQENNRYEHGY